jgi:hypothetical protein
MAYSTGGLISATDYNTLVTNGSNIGDQWGTGSTSHGLGQSTSAMAAVAVGNTVTAAQWTGLIQAINSCLAHEGQTAITPTSVTAGNLITAYASITSGSSTAYANSGTTGLALTAGAANTTSYASAWGTTGNRGLLFTQTVTFASADAARYFYNAGGKISLSFSRSGGSATTRNTDWTAIAAACGTITHGYKNTTKAGGSGTPTTLLNATNGGYWGALSGVTHFLQYDSSAGYTNDYIQTVVTFSGATVTFLTYWINAHVQAYQDYVDGTTSTSLVISSPATTYLANSWGTPTFGGSVALY